MTPTSMPGWSAYPSVAWGNPPSTPLPPRVSMCWTSMPLPMQATIVIPRVQRPLGIALDISSKMTANICHRLVTHFKRRPTWASDTLIYHAKAYHLPVFGSDGLVCCTYTVLLQPATLSHLYVSCYSCKSAVMLAHRLTVWSAQL